ncbi:MAG: hypothetical protein K9L87_06155 [Candidatus Omnitrophica bacterium]|nr:hypothetical protein [Candidatus Omnitrophota bacterium]MCF7898313.1 hypothetical protein [Candidatus Omnitrophota bacterium]
MTDLKLTKAEIKEGAPFAALSYIFCLWILVFIFKKDNKFSYFHARQAVVIFFAEVVCLVFQFIPVFGILFILLNFLLMLIALYGIYLSLTGSSKKIPVIGKLADKFVI